MKRFLLFLLALAFLSFSGCVHVDPDVEKPAHELAQNGLDEFNDGDYKKSIEYFEKLRDWYPFSKHAKLAELKIADAHYFLKDYDEAMKKAIFKFGKEKSTSWGNLGAEDFMKHMIPDEIGVATMKFQEVGERERRWAG